MSQSMKQVLGLGAETATTHGATFASGKNQGGSETWRVRISNLPDYLDANFVSFPL